MKVDLTQKLYHHHNEADMTNRLKGPVALTASCAAIFWPGAFIFSFPGVMGQVLAGYI
jgi:hypothetical protein